MYWFYKQTKKIQILCIFDSLLTVAVGVKTSSASKFSLWPTIAIKTTIYLEANMVDGLVNSYFICCLYFTYYAFMYVYYFYQYKDTNIIAKMKNKTKQKRKYLVVRILFSCTYSVKYIFLKELLMICLTL